MTITQTTDAEIAVLRDLKGTRDAISVRRVFGDPYTVDGVTIIPVARVAGGGGGGGGEGTGPEEQQGRGFGTGFGIGAHPVGVYEIRGGVLKWKPSVDVDRLARGGLVLTGLIALLRGAVLLRRSR